MGHSIWFPWLMVGRKRNRQYESFYEYDKVHLNVKRFFVSFWMIIQIVLANQKWIQLLSDILYQLCMKSKQPLDGKIANSVSGKDEKISLAIYHMVQFEIWCKLSVKTEICSSSCIFYSSFLQPGNFNPWWKF